jgi:hypothetical protein
MKKIHLFLLLILFAIVIAAGAANKNKNKPPVDFNEPAPTATSTAQNAATSTAVEQNASTTTAINNFDDCVAAGKKVDGEAPHRRCVVSDTLAYIEIETCKATTGESMNIFEAQRIFDASACSREGSAKEIHVCDEANGTWAIGILTYAKDCDPACIIDVKTKTAKIDWRCKK